MEEIRKLYIIKATDIWNDYANDKQYVVIDSAGQADFTCLRSDATRFSSIEEVLLMMNKLRVNWEIVEVRGNAWNK